MQGCFVLLSGVFYVEFAAIICDVMIMMCFNLCHEVVSSYVKSHILIDGVNLRESLSVIFFFFFGLTNMALRIEVSVNDLITKRSAFIWLKF